MDSAIGFSQWADLVNDIDNMPPQPDDWMCRQALDDFMAALAPVRATVLAQPKECRVFVSHRTGKPDEEHAEQIAWHATQNGYEYWLDVHDPILNRYNNIPTPSPAKEVLIAAIIEIALLNCSHLLAVITQNSAGSLWIPYEFGRAKLQLVLSDNSSTWLDNQTKLADCGEYIRLCPVNRSTKNVEAWLQQGHARASCSILNNVPWPHKPNPHPLPN